MSATGPGKKPRVTVVLLHAFPLDERMWELQVEALAGHDVHAPRLYGRGSSIDDWAAQILDDVDGPVAAVGASMGGYVALSMAARAPDRVTGLLLASSRAAGDSPERRAFRDELIERLRAGDQLDGAAASADELVAATVALRDRADHTEVVRAFAGPLLVAAGDRDPLLSVNEARGVADLAPHGRLEIFAGAGHLVSVEQPQEFNRVLLDFAAQAS
jgi:pimeloyl-ACP methyl ester carboxylesterase